MSKVTNVNLPKFMEIVCYIHKNGLKGNQVLKGNLPDVFEKQTIRNDLSWLSKNEFLICSTKNLGGRNGRKTSYSVDYEGFIKYICKNILNLEYKRSDLTLKLFCDYLNTIKKPISIKQGSLEFSLGMGAYQLTTKSFPKNRRKLDNYTFEDWLFYDEFKDNCEALFIENQMNGNIWLSFSIMADFFSY